MTIAEGQPWQHSDYSLVLASMTSPTLPLILTSQYVSAGKTPTQAQKEVTALYSCFGTYEVPPGNRNHLENAGLMPSRNLQSPIGRWATSFVGTVQL
jgi:hypothetical protein